jgi:colicin import membrane protein
MAKPRLDGGLVISATAHAAVLLWAGISFAAKPLITPPVDSMPVDIISTKDFSELMAGSKNAPKKEAPKPLVEKKAEPKPVENQMAKVSEKPEIAAATEAAAAPPPPAPKPAPKPPEVKQEPKPKEPEKKPDAEALKREDKKDPIKEELKKQEAKPTPPKPEPPKPKIAEPKPEREQPKFDANRIAALLDKREPRRLAAAGDVLNTAPMLGTTTGNAPRLSQSEIDALRARLMQLWNPPAGIRNQEELVVRVRMQLGRDGKLIGNPQVLNSGSGFTFQSARDSAVRAIFRGQPFDMLRAETYETWKDVEVTFDPRDMVRG